MLPINPQRAISDLRTLAQFGRLGTGVNRRSLTADDVAARAWLLERMRTAGLEAEIDGIGNVIGRTPGCHRHVLIGSHTDSVPKGGWLDGAMGVIFGLELARAAVEAGERGDLGIEVISFNDEEGRFAGLMGSSVFCAKRHPDDALGLKADDGTLLGDALAAAGYAGRPIAKLDPSRHVAYLEAHIEQGPVLEDAGKKIGVVTEIVGVERAKATFTGRADHAGTTPMALRRDAAAALYEFALEFAAFCRVSGSPRTVWNLGLVQFDPGAYNVVTRQAEIGIEYRDGSTRVLDRIRAAIPECAARCAARHNVEWRVDEGVRTTPAGMDAGIMECIERAATSLGASFLRMPSGAGHDAMLFARHIPTGMVFVPSIGGRSHDLAEDTGEEDIALGLRVFAVLVDDILRGKH
ncbi:MAG: hydantoinase/carbamoylase family amidase [Gammaproteobacteria bacterium]|nr:hydantoinase/carbamoylase family amidase [Gammaproteobacteria bacterium]